MNRRWYLAALPLALVSNHCSNNDYPVYGPSTYTSGGSSSNSGGYVNVGGAESDGGDVDAGSPTGGTTSSPMSVRYGPIASVNTGGNT